MPTVFSIAFSGLFIAFGVAAIVGHVLLIDALIRPFFGRVATAAPPTPMRRRLMTRPAN